ncbi:MAG: amidase family protein [Myxococcaceae bacterium]|nr:amidase family protein [Myxococcaceae bacterium]
MASTQIAFMPETRVARARLHEGALSGLTFAAKDSFAIRGHVSSAGHPDWARTHAPAERYAPVVEQLLHEGADLVGVTILDELAFGLAGINVHYGTPQNPRASGRLCGGSSCGSAAAVAAALCDFALGTDTAGSVRIPSAFCGLFGIRGTHGAISTDGVVPLAPSFDAVGFLARDAHTFDSVANVLFGNATSARSVERVLVADDAFALCDAGVPELLRDLVDRAARGLGARVELSELAPEGFGVLAAAFHRLRAREIWRAHGEWVRSVEPQFSPVVRARFEQARELSEHDSDESREHDEAVREQVRERIRSWLEPGTLLFLPPAPGVAPTLDASASALDTFRARALELSSIAALAGAPQIVVPARELDGAPLALSFIAAHGSDRWLSQLAAPLDRALES